MGDTIYALATAPGRAAIAVVRASGPRAGESVERLARRLPRARLATLATLRDPGTGEAIDRALVLWFPAPGSFTGEDAAEFHLHGGQATVEGLSAALSALGLRAAAPGEFSRRAFENGRLELSQAEGLADLIDAETAAQRGQALAQLGGALDRRHADWREALVGVAARLEAAIDFPDEDLPPALLADVDAGLAGLEAELADAAADARGERVRAGFRIALLGAPNSGKSSLMNRLTGRPTVIVSPHAGTTRDVVAVPWDAGPYRVLLADMAGVSREADEVEAEGVARALAWAAQADLRLLVVDGARSDRAWAEPAEVVRPGDWLVLNKADLPPGEDARSAPHAGASARTAVVSAATGEGVEALAEALAGHVAEAMGGADFPATTRARHRALLADALDAVRRARTASDPELMAEDVRLAVRALERITGRIGNEEVLGAVFSTFCIGK